MSWKQDAIDGLKKLVEEQGLPLIEVAVKKEIDAKSDGVVDLIFAKIEAVTPGWADALLEGQKDGVKAEVKAELLKLADKISDKV